MPDQKPPRTDGDERETLQELLQFQRDSLVRKVSGVDEEAARTSPVSSGTTLLWLTKHLAHAESLWILQRFAGRDDALPDESVGSEDTLAAAVDAYRTNWARVDAVVASASSLDQPCRAIGDGAPANLRWVLMHLLEETARHAGHADILRELIDGETGR
ncbi:MAG TPA: DinB family protein [Acidimicrobiales bacterium]|nr:DinB family protein [Acidimicrobiales bacterium]